MTHTLELSNIRIVHMFPEDKFRIQIPREIEWDISIPMRVFIKDHVLAIHPIGFHIWFHATVYGNVRSSGGQNQSGAMVPA